MTNRNSVSLGSVYAIVSDSHVPMSAWADAAAALADASVTVIQLRAKSAADNERLAAARAVCARLKACDYRGLVVVNDRVDLTAVLMAELADAVRVGVHLGQDDLSPRDARTLLGSEVVVGLSTHSVEQVVAAQQEPVDYLGFGPVFDTTTKNAPDPTVGLARLQEAAGQSSLPVVAIGGLDATRGRLALQAGATSVAMVSALTPAGAGLAGLTERARAIATTLDLESRQ